MGWERVTHRRETEGKHAGQIMNGTLARIKKTATQREQKYVKKTKMGAD